MLSMVLKVALRGAGNFRVVYKRLDEAALPLIVSSSLAWRGRRCIKETKEPTFRKTGILNGKLLYKGK